MSPGAALPLLFRKETASPSLPNFTIEVLERISAPHNEAFSFSTCSGLAFLPPLQALRSRRCRSAPGNVPFLFFLPLSLHERATRSRPATLSGDFALPSLRDGTGKTLPLTCVAMIFRSFFWTRAPLPRRGPSYREESNSCSPPFPLFLDMRRGRLPYRGESLSPRPSEETSLPPPLRRGAF